ncbi:putative sterigmatocystin biosynthesis P450 monooxygenase stcF [Lasiodiplodia hormozganensis]|uniref:Sterigmatocystin biosynthesis P450 monooxygenase stcF n=1 Tax=Lasiodiplodia hormozganensis TaxID=869390 RepID=A0AA40CH67_9PEZI|nr:putative sterigmatocystin biosynthesis P450 monooxygenase stcF [Lasiodiplodia hormozganensis]
MDYNLDPSNSLREISSFADAPAQSPLSMWTLLAFIPLAILVGLVTKGLYNVYLHPLSKIPGPFLSTFTEVVYLWYWVKGDLVSYIYDLHRQYGKTVRLAPNRLSFLDGEVWKDLHGYKTSAHKGVTVMKDPEQYGPESNGRFSMLATFDDAQHKALRKIFQPGFSDRALKAQEHIIRGHVNKLVRNVSRSIAADPEQSIDFVRMFNCTTFDIVGELAFGESLGLLDDGKMYGWVESLNESLILAPFITLADRFPLVTQLVMMMLPESVKNSQLESTQYASDMVEKRLAKGKVTDKPDFWSLVLNSQDSDILDAEDMKANANLFMAAGSETTATTLSGLMYNLLSNPDKMKKLLQEIRSSFATEEDLTIENIQKLKYLAACFDESMRMYPATPLGPPRVVINGGGQVNGNFVPEKTTVSISIYSTYHSSNHFKDHDTFVPERWMPSDPLYEKYADDRREVFQPFSYGPRNCIGKNLALHEMRLIAASLLWHFDFELCEASRGTWTNQKCYWGLWYKDPLWLKAKPIGKNAIASV